MECQVHDKWRLEKDCTCNSERKWVRSRMLKESLEAIAGVRGTAPIPRKDTKVKCNCGTIITSNYLFNKHEVELNHVVEGE